MHRLHWRRLLAGFQLLRRADDRVQPVQTGFRSASLRPAAARSQGEVEDFGGELDLKGLFDDIFRDTAEFMTPNSILPANDELQQRVGVAGLEAVDVVIGELCEHGVAVAEQIGLVNVNVHFAVSTIRLHQHVRRSCCCEDQERKAKLAEL